MQHYYQKNEVDRWYRRERTLQSCSVMHRQTSTLIHPPPMFQKLRKIYSRLYHAFNHELINPGQAEYFWWWCRTFHSLFSPDAIVSKSSRRAEVLHSENQMRNWSVSIVKHLKCLSLVVLSHKFIWHFGATHRVKRNREDLAWEPSRAARNWQDLWCDTWS